MIPPLTDFAPGRDGTHSPAFTGEAMPSFADFLGSAQPAVGSSDEAQRAAGAQAQLFNQHGFFGRAQAWAMPVPAQPTAAIAPPPSLAVDAETAIVVAPSGPATTQDAPVRMVGQAAPSLPFDSASAAPPHPAMSIVQAPVRAVPLPPTRPRPVEHTPSGPTPRAASVRMPPRSMTATVAVALHATARGVEVAAQVAGLDERDRAALADEVAALLSAHGYAPAHISVIAAARAAHREHR